MRVRILHKGIPTCPFQGLAQSEADRVPYTNKITGESDPMIVFTPPSRFAHESTLLKMGFTIQEI